MPLISLIKYWPLTMWWLLGLLTGVTAEYIYAYHQASYDDQGIGTFLFYLLLITTLPVQAGFMGIEALRSSETIGSHDTFLALLISGVLVFILDILWQKIILARWKKT